MADLRLRQLEREYAQTGDMTPLLRYYRRIGRTTAIKPLRGIGANKVENPENESVIMSFRNKI